MKRQESGKFRTENEEEILYQINIYKIFTFMEPQYALEYLGHNEPGCRFDVKFLDLERNPMICCRIPRLE